MASILTIPGANPRRAIAVKRAITARAAALALCPAAADQCVARAFKLLRTGSSAGWAMAEGIKLAKRIAAASQRGAA